MAGYQGPMSDEPLDKSSSHAHSALSGSVFDPSTPDQVSEAEKNIHQKIIQLLQKQQLASDQLEIFVKNNSVTLTGKVRNKNEEALVVSLVEGLKEVHDVISLLQIAENPIDQSLSGQDNLTLGAKDLNQF
jgi:hypothetical protein